MTYKIEQQSYGYKFTFKDTVNEAEMLDWFKELKNKLNLISKPFGILIDMRSLAPLSSGAKKTIELGQQFCKQKGMERSAVIIDSPVVKLQFERLGKNSNLNERYINSTDVSNFESKAVAWITKGIEPK